MVNRKRRIVSAAFVALICAGACGCVPLPEYVVTQAEYYGIMLDNGVPAPGVAIAGSHSDESGIIHIEKAGYWFPVHFMGDPADMTNLHFSYPDGKVYEWREIFRFPELPNPKIIVCNRKQYFTDSQKDFVEGVGCDAFEYLQYDLFGRPINSLIWYHYNGPGQRGSAKTFTREAGDCRTTPLLLEIYHRAFSEYRLFFVDTSQRMLREIGCEPATAGSCEEYMKTVKCVP